MKKRSPKNAKRAGFSLLELQVAFLVLGIALTGIVPLLVMQSKQLKQLQDRFKRTYKDDVSAEVYYLAPSRDLAAPDEAFADSLLFSTNAWARRLGAVASLIHEDDYDLLPALPERPDPDPDLIDNEDAGPAYTESGTGWHDGPMFVGFRDRLRRHNKGEGSEPASWTFTGLDPNWNYQVLITWVKAVNQADQAPFTVYDNTVAIQTFLVDQKNNDPDGETYEGSLWETLDVFDISSSTLKVELKDASSGKVVADAVRIIPVNGKNEVEVVDGTLDKSIEDETVSIDVLVTPRR